jgi:integrase
VLVSRGPKPRRPNSKPRPTLTFRACYYLPTAPGVPRYKVLGRYPDRSDFAALRDEARTIRIDAKAGIDPHRPKLTGNVKEVVDRYIEDYCKPNQRTWSETERILNLYIVPAWADRHVEQIEYKADIAPHLNAIAAGKYKHNGKSIGTPAVARLVRAHVVTFFNWYVEMHGSPGFRSPMIKSMQVRKWKPKDRERALSDTEIKALWLACDQMGHDPYAAVVKCALLTMQRFRKVGAMRRSEIKLHMTIDAHMQDGKLVPAFDVPNVWNATREDDPPKKRVSVVPLPPLALSIIDSVPIIDADKGTDHVFTTTGRGPLRGWSKYKSRLDKKMLAILKQWAQDAGDDPDQVTLQPWQHRDLRRTCRSLMARLEVRDDVAEHAMGHVPPGVKGVYDRYDRLREKRAAFALVADWIGGLVNPPDNVVPLRPAAG